LKNCHILKEKRGAQCARTLGPDSDCQFGRRMQEPAGADFARAFNGEFVDIHIISL